MGMHPARFLDLRADWISAGDTNSAGGLDALLVAAYGA